MQTVPPRRWLLRSALSAAGLALSFGLFGCGPAATKPSFAESAALPGCELTQQNVVADWISYRKDRPFHAQEVAASEPDGRGCRTLILSEPPPGTTPESFSDIHPALRTLSVRRHAIGVDGYTEDFVGVIPAMTDAELSDLTSRLHLSLFGTAYRARLAPISAPASWKGSLDVEVRPAELHGWVLGPEASFWPVDGGGRERAEDLLDPSQTGVFLSAEPGIVLWSFPKEGDFSEQRSNVRIFGLESDLVLGALSDEDTVIVIGRERVAPVDVLPPLRFESVQILATTSLDQLAQSYERTQLFAGTLPSGKDWAPILLSPAIVDTEVGSVLNIADQLLKRWSMAKQVSYERFDYPNEPPSGPFPKSIAEELHADVLTFNWNTARTGAVSPLAGGRTFYWMHRTGALNVSYLPDEQPDPRTASYEDRARDFFAERADPHLVRAVQHAALFQAFRQLGVTTEDPIAGVADAIGPDPATDTLIAAGAGALTRLQGMSDADLTASAKKLVDRELDGIESPTEAQIQKILARAPKALRAAYEARMREKIQERWAEIAAEYKAEKTAELGKSAKALRQVLVDTNDAAAPRHIALALVYRSLVSAAANNPGEFRAMTGQLRRAEVRARAAEIAAAASFVRKRGLDRLDPTAVGDILSAISDVDVVEQGFRDARNKRTTSTHVRTPSVVRSSAAAAGAKGGHNLGSEVPRVPTPTRPVDLARVSLDRTGVSLGHTPLPVRVKSDSLISLAVRPVPAAASGGARLPPPHVPDSGWARMTEDSSSGCGPGCVALSPYSNRGKSGERGALPRARFQFAVGGTVGRAGSMYDIADALVRSAKRQARLGRRADIALTVELRGADITPDEALGVADSSRNAFTLLGLDRRAGFVVDKGDGTALLDSYDMTDATVSEPKKDGDAYVCTVTIPRKEGFLMRLLSKVAPSAKLREPAALPQGTRTAKELAAELRERFGEDLLLELAGQAQPRVVDREPGVVRAQHAGTSSPTL
ncbi:MAG: hypothetical protein R3B70_41475 [Polyangiaceae bacterium]